MSSCSLSCVTGAGVRPEQKNEWKGEEKDDETENKPSMSIRGVCAVANPRTDREAAAHRKDDDNMAEKGDDWEKETRNEDESKEWRWAESNFNTSKSDQRTLNDHSSTQEDALPPIERQALTSKHQWSPPCTLSYKWT